MDIERFFRRPITRDPRFWVIFCLTAFGASCIVAAAALLIAKILITITG